MRRAWTSTAGQSNVSELQFVVVLRLLLLNYTSATDCDVLHRWGCSLELAFVTVVEEFLVRLWAKCHSIGRRLRPWMEENAASMHHIAAWRSSRADIGYIHGGMVEVRRCHDVLLMNLAG